MLWTLISSSYFVDASSGSIPFWTVSVSCSQMAGVQQIQNSKHPSERQGRLCLWNTRPSICAQILFATPITFGALVGRQLCKPTLSCGIKLCCINNLNQRIIICHNAESCPIEIIIEFLCYGPFKIKTFPFVSRIFFSNGLRLQLAYVTTL